MSNSVWAGVDPAWKSTPSGRAASSTARGSPGVLLTISGMSAIVRGLPAVSPNLAICLLVLALLIPTAALCDPMWDYKEYQENLFCSGFSSLQYYWESDKTFWERQRNHTYEEYTKSAAQTELLKRQAQADPGAVTIWSLLRSSAARTSNLASCMRFAEVRQLGGSLDSAFVAIGL